MERGAELWGFLRGVGAQVAVAAEDEENVVADLLAGEEAARRHGEIEVGLEHAVLVLGAHVVVAQQEPAVRMAALAALVEVPCGRTSGVEMEELEQVFFGFPEFQQQFLRDA